MTPLTVPKRSRNCTQCSRLFEPGDDYHSTLLGSEERLDRCENCREEKDGLVQWQGKVPQKPKKPEPKNRDEKALAWLHKALETGEEEQAYILALYLQRRKKLKLLPESNKRLLCEFEGGGATVTLAIPNLEQLAVERLQATIAERLRSDVA